MAQADIAAPVALEEKRDSQRGQSDLFVVWALIAAHTMQHVYTRGFLVLLPFMMESLGIGTIGAGIMEAIRRITSGIASVGGGVLTDRVQHLRGPILAGSIGLMGFGYLIIGVFPNYYVILIALGFAAAAGSIWHPPALGIISQRFPERRGYYISLHRSAGNVGETVAPAVFGLLLGIIAWQAVLWGVFPLAFGVAVLIMVYLRNIGGSKQQMVQGGQRSLGAQLGAIGNLLRYRSFVALLFVGGVRGIADGAVMLWLPIYLRRELEMDAWTIGLYVSLLTAIAIFTGPFFGRLSDTWGRGRVIFLIMACSTAIVTTMIFFNDGLALAGLVALAGVFMFSVNSLTQAGSMDMAEGLNLEGSMIGLLWGVNAFFGALSPIALGFITNWYGVGVFFLYASIFYAIGTAAALLLPGVLSGRSEAISR
ncbi:MAG: MFS transporter [Chloroflexota bacterium]|nr:MFS transporter [Chloroflexota bacterium]MDE2969185.1 MFS transporter [Chloroflexota bacterium]